MSAPAGTYNDGDILWDALEITINSKTFIFEDFSPMEESQTDVSNNVSAVPRGARHRRTLMAFNGTAQFPAGSTRACRRRKSSTPRWTSFGVPTAPFFWTATRRRFLPIRSVTP